MTRLRQLWYAPLLALAMGLVFLRALVIAKLVDVAGFAQFSGALLVSSTFSMLGGIGLYFLLQREMPIFLVHGRARRAAILLMQALVAAALCAVALVLPSLAGLGIGELPPALAAIGVVHGLSQQVFLIATVDCRSRGEPMTFALEMLLRATIVFAVSVAIGAAWGSAAAVLLAEAAITFALTARILRGVWRGAGIGWRAALALAIRHKRAIRWNAALALLAVACVGFTLANVDRWIAVRLLSGEGFAQYAFAWIVLLVAQSVQAVVSAAFYPMLVRRYAAGGRPAAFRLAAKVSGAALAAGLALAWPAHWAVVALVEHAYPAYREATGILGAFALIAVLRVSDFWSSHVVIVGQEKRLLALNLTAAAVVFAGWLWLPGMREASGDLALVTIHDLARLATVLALACYVLAAGAAWVARR